MRRLIVLALCLAFSPLAFANIAATAAWDVRTTGTNLNAGAFDPYVSNPGTDESQADNGTSITCTLTGSGTTATCVPAISSTTHGPGNTIKFASGTGCTTTRPFEILSQSGGTATFDASVGTATDVCVGVIGGGLLTIAQAYTYSVNGQIVYVKNGTYTITSALVPLCEATIGYNSTHGDFISASQATIEANRPLITTATNSTKLFAPASNCVGQVPIVFQFMATTNTAATRAIAICPSSLPHMYVDDVSFSGFTGAIGGDGSTCAAYEALTIRRMECTGAGSTSAYCIYQAGSFSLADSNIHGFSATANTTGIIYSPTAEAQVDIIRTIFDGNTVGSSQFVVNVAGTDGHLRVRDSVCYGTVGVTSYCFYTSSGSALTQIENTVIYGNGGYGIGVNVINAGSAFCDFCAFGSNTSSNTEGGPVALGNAITLTANPFTNASGHDFSLNSTAGGGALLRNLGYPGVMPAQNSTFYESVGIGPVNASAGGSVTPYSY